MLSFRMMIQEKIEYVSHLWDKLSPRERLVKFHFSNSLILYKDWKELSLHESDIVMNAARILVIGLKECMQQQLST